jgi:hypothetical protein
MKASERPKRERLNMRIPTELLRWAKGFVRSENKTLTQDYVDYLTEKRRLVEERYGKQTAISR